MTRVGDDSLRWFLRTTLQAQSLDPARVLTGKMKLQVYQLSRETTQRCLSAASFSPALCCSWDLREFFM